MLFTVKCSLKMSYYFFLLRSVSLTCETKPLPFNKDIARTFQYQIIKRDTPKATYNDHLFCFNNGFLYQFSLK